MAQEPLSKERTQNLHYHSIDRTTEETTRADQCYQRHTVTSEWRRSRRERELSQPANEALWEYVQESPEQQSPALLRTLIMDFLVNNVSDHKKLRIYEDWIEGRSYEEIMQIHSVSRAVVFRRFQECRRLVRWVLGIRPQKNRPA
jgi:DNA-directed RNA polymerase specialized sigma24 family protein